MHENVLAIQAEIGGATADGKFPVAFLRILLVASAP
jgi:hypothetical protein